MNVQIAEAFEPLFKPKRIKVFFGGRGGAKTVSFSKAALALGAQRRMRILCLREFQNSIEESVHSSLEDEIHTMGLEHLYNIQQTKIDGVNGTAIRYAQLARNIASIKSKHDIDIAWVEEAETISEKSLDTLIPTIRAPGSEIWFSYNPDREDAPVHQRYVMPYMEQIQEQGFYEDDEIYVAKVGFEHNPWFPAELQDDMDRLKEHDYKKYLHVYGGELNRSYADAIIQPEWVDAAIDAHKKLKIEPRGVRVMGFDPADEGNDAKAVALRHGIVVHHIETWRNGDIDDAISRAYSIAFEHRCTDIVYDGIGVGSTVKINLHKHGPRGIRYTNFIGSAAVDEPHVKYLGDQTNADVFYNLRAQRYWGLRDRFEATYRAVVKSEYIDPDLLISLDSTMKELPKLKSELTNIMRKRGRMNTRLLVESKDDMRARQVPSPNRADALMMCFANPVPELVAVSQPRQVVQQSARGWA